MTIISAIITSDTMIAISTIITITSIIIAIIPMITISSIMIIVTTLITIITILFAPFSFTKPFLSWSVFCKQRSASQAPAYYMSVCIYVELYLGTCAHRHIGSFRALVCQGSV